MKIRKQVGVVQEGSSRGEELRDGWAEQSGSQIGFFCVGQESVAPRPLQGEVHFFLMLSLG